jgi:hypothetical protein
VDVGLDVARNLAEQAAWGLLLPRKLLKDAPARQQQQQQRMRNTVYVSGNVKDQLT